MPDDLLSAKCKSPILAEMLGVTVKTVQVHAKNGVIPCISMNPYTFKLVDAVSAYCRYMSMKAKNIEKDYTTKADAELAKSEADARYKQARARMAELQLDELEGKLHRASDVEAVMTDQVYAIRGAMLAFPGRIAMDGANKSAAELERIARREVNKSLSELQNYQYNPEAFKEKVRARIGWDSQIVDEED